MTTNFETDASTQTVAAAWASSPLGQPEREVRYGFAAEPVAEKVGAKPIAKHALVAAALACGIGAGAALGLMLFDFAPTQPTVVVPGSDTRLPGQPPALPTATRSANASDSIPFVPAQKTASAPMIAAPPSGQGPADVDTPPVGTDGDTIVVVDIPIPDYPPLPDTPEDDPEDPEPPTPDPPVLDDPAFELPGPPAPEPDPPTFLPDLPLAPLPAPDPVLELPLAPSVELNPQPEPPSFGPSIPDFSLDFDPPAGLGS